MDNKIQLALVVGALLVTMIVVRSRPKIAASVWILTFCFLPVWIGPEIRVLLMPAVVVGVWVLLVILPARIKAVGLADLAVAFFTLVALTPLLVGGSSSPWVVVLTSQWLLAFSVGRVLAIKVDVRWIYGCVAVSFSAVAVLAITEYLTRHNPFVTIYENNSLYYSWAPILYRGGIPRVEGAFGHPIALGVCLAMALPLVFASRFRPWIKLVMVALISGAIVPTFSRTAMICAGLSIVLALATPSPDLSARVRGWALVITVGVAASLVPLVTSTFASAGDEATASAAYRGNLLSLIPDMSFMGFTTSALRSTSGELHFGSFRSIDSALILLGLTFGWLTLATAVFLLLCAVVRVLGRRADAATISVVAAVPALATVALITQYGMFFWFMSGLAVFSQVEAGANRRAQRLSGGAEHPIVEDPQAVPRPSPMLVSGVTDGLSSDGQGDLLPVRPGGRQTVALLTRGTTAAKRNC